MCEKKKTEQIHVLCNKKEKTAIQKEAKRRRMSTTQFMLMCALQNIIRKI